jgi:ATP-dependent DNA ligase
MDIKTQEIVTFGEKGQLKDDVLKFPILYSMDKGKKYRFWQIVVGLTKDEIEVDRSDTDGNWLDKITFIPVTKAMIERSDLPENAQGIYWTRSGQEGGAVKITKPTYVAKGTNIGRKNYTTAFTGAIRRVMTKYNEKIKDGNTPDKESLKPRDHVYKIEELLTSETRGKTPWRVFPMAFHSVENAKNWPKIKYPAIIQPKYDGTRLLVVSHPDIPNQIDSYSRGRETYAGQEHIIDELKPMLENYPGLYVDGELWKKGYGLQDISGSSRRIKSSKKGDPIKLEFHIFDAFYLDKAQTFEQRSKLLDELFKNHKSEYVFQVPNTIVDSKENALEIYEGFISESSQLEGAMLRNLDSPYELGINKEERTYKSLKIKPRPESEFKIIDFTDGKGKNKNLVIWVCEGPEPKNKRFTVTPNWPEAKREKTFKLFKSNPDKFDLFRNEEAVIEYSILSNDGMPQQPKFLRFRKPELDVKLLDLIQDFL